MESTTSLSSRKKADSNAECDENHEGVALKHREVMHKHHHSPAVMSSHQIFFLMIEHLIRFK